MSLLTALQKQLFSHSIHQSRKLFFEHPLVLIERISENAPFLNEVLNRLAKIGIMTLFVEGGSRVHSSFINEVLTDELHLYMAPKLIGN